MFIPHVLLYSQCLCYVRSRFRSLGTGIAPFRAFVQERAMLKKQNVKVGPMTLYYGCRYAAKDFLYKDEFQKYEQAGVLKLRPACSRDQKQKIYVQHRILEDADQIYQQLLNQNA